MGRSTHWRFLLEGWEKRSVWGWDDDEFVQSYWADLYRNENSGDEPDGKFRGGKPAPMWSLDWGALYNEILNFTNADPDHLEQVMNDSMR